MKLIYLSLFMLLCIKVTTQGSMQNSYWFMDQKDVIQGPFGFKLLKFQKDSIFFIGDDIETKKIVKYHIDNQNNIVLNNKISFARIIESNEFMCLFEFPSDNLSFEMKFYKSIKNNIAPASIKEIVEGKKWIFQNDIISIKYKEKASYDGHYVINFNGIILFTFIDHTRIQYQYPIHHISTDSILINTGDSLTSINSIKK